MRQLCIYILLFALYPIVSFADSIDVNNVPTIQADSIPLLEVNPVTVPQDTNRNIELENILNAPKDSNVNSNFIDSLLKSVPNDTTREVNTELRIPSIRTYDSASVSSDSINVLLHRNIILEDNRRIEFRSVYTDTTDVDYKPPRKIIVYKWMSDNQDTVIRYKNIIGFYDFYGYYSYGIGANIYKRLSNDADFLAGINLSYTFDRRTSEDLDSTGNPRLLDHESRLYPIIFNAGLEKYFLQNRTDWKIKPILIFGFAPAIIFSTPYESSFFSSLKKIQISYGIGVFGGLGFDWQAFRTVGINLTARYAFIPILFGKEIYYYKGFLVKNIGGIYVNLGFTLLKEYFSKN